MIMDLCIVAIFKNESHIFTEWIAHYLKQGVDKIFLIDNGSDDNYQLILQPYIDSKKVYLEINPVKHKQKELYNLYFREKVERYEWILICDLDEFVYARKGFSTIKEYLRSLNPQVAQVVIPWKLFGSNGLKMQPESIIKSFNKRQNCDKIEGVQMIVNEWNTNYTFAKSIVRTKFLKNFNVHIHDVTNPLYISSDSRSDSTHPNNMYTKISESILEDSCLHMNHYMIQSHDWFMRVKATRGDSAMPETETYRDERYFHNLDKASNDIDDNELLLIYNT
jgi:glycosyltransferase involved in cell wall biosynthesis